MTLKNKLARYTIDSTNALTQKDQKLAQLQTENEKLSNTLKNVAGDLEELEDNYRKEKDKNDEFDDKIREISKTVGVLNKLSKTDEELLQKYSKVYFLNENYIPSDITQIEDQYVLPGKDAAFFHGDALPFLENMIEDAARDDIDLSVISAYRSFDQQEALKGQYTTVYGSGANTFSADQGYSEHQLGTTVDLTDAATAGTYNSFADTKAYAWLLKNAYKHGFTLSYPEKNGYYIFEPWHWRFVGEDLAEYLYDNDLNFYDLEQREIDEYLISIFD
tara:strand:- start:4749 stop:5576 length:828 start_codon:yes stop_codon:yes gene_type:complete